MGVATLARSTSLLLLYTLGTSACATNPNIVLPPSDADPIDRARAYRRYQIDSVNERSISSDGAFYTDYTARLGTGQEVKNPEHLAQAVPSSKKMKRYGRRYRGLRIASWISLPLGVASMIVGAVTLARLKPEGESDGRQRQLRFGLATLGTGAVLNLTHYFLYSLSSTSARKAFEHYNQALENELRMKRRRVEPAYLPDI